MGKAAKKGGLSTLQWNVLYKLEKYREAILMESGVYYRATGANQHLQAAVVNSLAELGLCRIDRAGESTFAVFVRRPEA